MKTLLALLISFCLTTGLSQTTVYVSTTGSDANPGTIGSPKLTIEAGLTAIGSNGTVYLRGGTYARTSTVTLSNTATTTKNLYAYSTEIPILDFGDVVDNAVVVTGKKYHVKGLRVANAGRFGVGLSGDSNIVENCSVYGIEGSGNGFNLYNSKGSLILNCDSFNNADLPSGQNTDGFAALLDCSGSIFRGCRAWANGDDGWDFYYATSPVTMDSCWSFDNGRGTEGNGNGFKLGPGDAAAYPRHVLKHCLAFDNKNAGYDQNSNTTGQTFYNCNAFRNPTVNFYMAYGTSSIFVNCISYVAGSFADDLGTTPTSTTNSWTLGTTLANAQFVSQDTTGVTGARDANGNLPVLNFLRLASTSPFVNAGTNVGLNFNGSAPEVGAYEFQAAGLGFVAMYHSVWAYPRLPTTGYNWGGITHLIWFGAEALASPPYSNYRNDGGSAYLDSVIADAHADGVKVIFCLAQTNNFQDFYTLTRDSASVENAVTAWVSHLDAHNYDGIDIDWEASTDGAGFALLARRIRARFDARGQGELLTAAIGRTPSNAHPAYSINQSFDYVWSMNYDANTFYNCFVSFGNPLHDPAINYPQIGGSNGVTDIERCTALFLASGVQPEKLAMGLSLYPSYWHEADIYEPGGRNYIDYSHCPGTPNHCYNPNNDCQQAYYPPSWSTAIYPKLVAGVTEHYDSVAAMAWIGDHSAFGGHGYYYNYNNGQAFAQKLEWMRDNNLAGVMLFAQEQQYTSPAIEWPIGSGIMTTTPLLDQFRSALTPAAPTITTQPASASASVGETETFSISVSGSTPLVYQWQKNTVNIGSATSSSYTTPVTVIGDNGGSFRCIVSNTLGTVTSSPAILSVTNSIPIITTHPSNQTAAEGQTATFFVVSSGNRPLTYQWQKNDANISGATDSSYTTPALQITDNTSTFRCVVANNQGSVTSGSAILTVLTSVFFIGDDFSDGTLHSALWTATNPSSASTFSFTGAGTADALFKIAIPSGTSYDAGNSPRIMQRISNVDGGWLFKYQGIIQPETNYSAVGFLFKGGSDYIRVLLAYDAVGAKVYSSSYIGGTLTNGGVNTTITNASVVYLKVVRTGSTWTVTHSYNGSTYLPSGSFTASMVVDSVGLHVSNCCSPSAPAITGSFDYVENIASPLTNEDPLVGSPPVITVQPTNQSANAGATATFTQTISGTGLAHQWQKNQVNISAATSLNYTTPVVVYATDNGATFRCVTSNSSGTVTSSEAVLTVNVAANILTNPVSVTVDSGTNAIFTVVAEGVPAVTYQWQRSNSNITGAVFSSYQLIAVRLDSGATFRCIVNNSAGTDTSSTATLHVNAVLDTTVAIDVTEPVLGQELIAGATVYTRANLYNVVQATITLLPTGTVLGTYPQIPTIGNILIPGGVAGEVSFVVPADSGTRRIEWSGSGIADTSANFHISVTNAITLDVTSIPDDKPIGTRGYKVFHIGSNADSVTVTWRRVGDRVFKPSVLARNISPNTVQYWPLDRNVVVYPLSRAIIVRFNAFLGGQFTYIEKTIPVTH